MFKPPRYYNNGGNNEEGGTNTKSKLMMTKSFTPQEGNTRKLVTNRENTSKVGKGCCEKSKE
jgi:hypothetical protein